MNLKKLLIFSFLLFIIIVLSILAGTLLLVKTFITDNIFSVNEMVVTPIVFLAIVLVPIFLMGGLAKLKFDLSPKQTILASFIAALILVLIIFIPSLIGSRSSINSAFDNTTLAGLGLFFVFFTFFGLMLMIIVPCIMGFYVSQFLSKKIQKK